MATARRDGGLNLLLVDDHAVVREGLKRLLQAQPQPAQVCEASTGFEALDCLRQQPIDLVVVDLFMPGMSGLELIERIRREFVALPVLVLSMHTEAQYALRALKAGANGYVSKDSATTELLRAVHKVAAGGAFLSAQLTERVVHQLSGQHQGPDIQTLTNRELEILQRIANGERSVDIAHALNLSIKTVSTHKVHIQDKLQLDSTAALVRFGMEHRLGLGPVWAQPWERPQDACLP